MEVRIVFPLLLFVAALSYIGWTLEPFLLSPVLPETRENASAEHTESSLARRRLYSRTTPVQNQLYMVNYGGTIAVCPLSFPTTSCPTPQNPGLTFGSADAIAISGSIVYLTTILSDSVSVCSISSQTLLCGPATGSNFHHPSGVAVVGSTAYVVNLGGGGSVTICSISGQSLSCGQPTGSHFANPVGIAVVGTMALIANSGGNSVTVCSIFGRSLLCSQPSGRNFNVPFGIAIVGSTAYITNNGGNSITVCRVAAVLDCSDPPTTLGGLLSSPTGIVAVGSQLFITNSGSNAGVISCSVSSTTTAATLGSSCGVLVQISNVYSPIGIAVTYAPMSPPPPSPLPPPPIPLSPLPSPRQPPPLRKPPPSHKPPLFRKPPPSHKTSPSHKPPLFRKPPPSHKTSPSHKPPLFRKPPPSHKTSPSHKPPLFRKPPPSHKTSPSPHRKLPPAHRKTPHRKPPPPRVLPILKSPPALRKSPPPRSKRPPAPRPPPPEVLAITKSPPPSLPSPSPPPPAPVYRLYVTNQGNNTVSVCTLQGRDLTCGLFSDPYISAPYAITTDGSSVYFTNSPGDSVTACTISGAQLQCGIPMMSGAFVYPWGIALAESTIYITDANGVIFACSVSGQILTNCTQFTNTNDVNLGSRFLFSPLAIVVDGSRIFMTDTEGQKLSVCQMSAPGQIASCAPATGQTVENSYGIAISGNMLYVTQPSNAIMVCSISGLALTCGAMTGNNLNTPTGIAVFGNTAFVTNRGANSLTVCTISGFNLACDAPITNTNFDQPQGLVMVPLQYPNAQSLPPSQLADPTPAPLPSLPAYEIYMCNGQTVGRCILSDQTLSCAALNVLNLNEPQGVLLNGSTVYVMSSSSITGCTLSGSWALSCCTPAVTNLNSLAGIAINGSTLYAASAYTITVCSFADGQLSCGLSMQANFGFPTAIAVAGSHLYITNEQAKSLTACSISEASLNCSSASFVLGITGSYLDKPIGLAINGSTVYVASQIDSIALCSLSDGTPRCDFTTGSYFTGPSGISILESNAVVSNRDASFTVCSISGNTTALACRPPVQAQNGNFTIAMGSSNYLFAARTLSSPPPYPAPT